MLRNVGEEAVITVAGTLSSGLKLVREEVIVELVTTSGRRLFLVDCNALRRWLLAGEVISHDMLRKGAFRWLAVLLGRKPSSEDERRGFFR